jgi:plastocyanin
MSLERYFSMKRPVKHFVLLSIALLSLLIAATVSAYAATSGKAPAKPAAAKTKTYDVLYTAKGFSRAKLTIKSGDSVRWTAKAGMDLWLAEGTHPIHTDCKYCPQGKNEGAYVTVKDGKTYTFTFKGAGTANFHDHMKPDMKMTVVVK